MKKILILISLQLVVVTGFAQDFSKISASGFTEAEDYKNAQSEVLACSEYLLSNPVSQDEMKRNMAFQYMFKWMEGTPDYTFSLDSEVMNLTKGDDNLLILYFASMVKTVLESPDSKISDEEISKQATETLVSYCANEANGQKPSKAIKKLIKQRSK